ncbi:hypothetical protein BDQ17DRAFT_1545075 [Cyathus striatus]|nr:hypothetical protein BDQ17DRAFT_1545075 [Cyathus striatus]
MPYDNLVLNNSTPSLRGGTVDPEALYSCHSSDYLDYPDGSLVATRIPSRSRTDGTECIIYGCMKREIYNTPRFPAPLPSLATNQTPAYRIASTGNKMGQGMFATRDINVGQLILVERPLLMFPIKFTAKGSNSPTCATATTGVHLALLKLALDRMNNANKKAFMGLSISPLMKKNDPTNTTCPG